MNEHVCIVCGKHAKYDMFCSKSCKNKYMIKHMLVIDKHQMRL